MAAFERGDDVAGVEAEWSGDDDGVEVFAVEEGAEIFVRGDGIATDLIELVEAWLVDVSGGDDAEPGTRRRLRTSSLPRLPGPMTPIRKGELSVEGAIQRAASASAREAACVAAASEAGLR